MKPERLLGMTIVLLLLIGGLVIGRALRPDRISDDKTPDLAGSSVQGFRDWFWERRTFDLMTQVGLIFAGALGVAAILPGQDEAPSEKDAMSHKSGRSP